MMVRVSALTDEAYRAVRDELNRRGCPYLSSDSARQIVVRLHSADQEILKYITAQGCLYDQEP